MKKRQVNFLGKDIYTLIDLRESNEELSKVCFENLLKKNPSYLTCGVEVIGFATIPFLNYPRWHDRHFKVHKCKVVTPRPTTSTREVENLSDETEGLCSSS